MRTTWQGVVRSIALVAMHLLLVQPAWGGAPADPVRMRVESRGDFARVSFDWRRIVDYDVSRSGQAVTISFRREAAIEGTDADAGRSALIRQATQRRADGRTEVTLLVPEKARIRYFRKGPEIIVDVMPALPLHRRATDGAALAARSTPAAPALR